MSALTQNKFLNDVELKKLKKLLKKNRGERDAILISIGLYTGARCQEILNIRKRDIKNKTITIRGLKGSNDRTIPIVNKEFYIDLLQYIKELNNDDKLFNISTRRVRAIWELYKPNPNLGFHCLRHTVGVLLYSSSKDILAVKTILGHKSIDSTMIYMNFVESNKVLKEVMKCL